MEFYAITNGNFIEGYYLKHENAVKAMRKLDALMEKLKDHPNAESKSYWIEILETED